MNDVSLLPILLYELFAFVYESALQITASDLTYKIAFGLL